MMTSVRPEPDRVHARELLAVGTSDVVEPVNALPLVVPAATSRPGCTRPASPSWRRSRPPPSRSGTSPSGSLRRRRDLHPVTREVRRDVRRRGPSRASLPSSPPAPCRSQATAAPWPASRRSLVVDRHVAVRGGRPLHADRPCSSSPARVRLPPPSAHSEFDSTLPTSTLYSTAIAPPPPCRTVSTVVPSTRLDRSRSRQQPPVVIHTDPPATRSVAVHRIDAVGPDRSIQTATLPAMTRTIPPPVPRDHAPPPPASLGRYTLPNVAPKRRRR